MAQPAPRVRNLGDPDWREYCDACQCWTEDQVLTPTEVTLAGRTMTLALCGRCRRRHAELNGDGT